MRQLKGGGMEINMKIVVCIKPVLEKYINGTNQGHAYKMNPYDMFALDKILKIRNARLADFQLICICMASNTAIDVLRQARAMGVDKVILVNDHGFSGSDTYATSYILSKAIDKIGGVDFLVCGEKSVDGETGQVFWQLIERLGYTGLGEVVGIQQINSSFVRVIIEENSTRKIIRCKYPLAISFVGYQTYTDLISLRHLRKALNEEIETWDSQSLVVDLDKCGSCGSKTQVISTKSIFSKREGLFLTGNIEEEAKFIINSIYKNKDKQ